MAAIKAHEVDRYLAKPSPGHAVVLIYGPDTGLVSERAALFSRNCGVDLSDPFSLVRLDMDDIGSDPARLADEAGTIGMFGGKRLIRISGTTRRDVSASLSAVLENPPQDAVILIEAGDLKKSTPVRKLVESSPNAVALPCYQDNDSALNQLIQQEIVEQGLSIDNETRWLLKSLLGGDRQASRNELQKLALYAQGQKTVGPDDIRAIVGDASSLAVDDVVDAAAAGETARLEENLATLVESGMAPDMIMIFALRHFQALHQARYRMEAGNSSAAQAVKAFRPPVHFSRTALVTKALEKWDRPSMERSMERLDRASFECRANPALALSIAGTALLAIAIEARLKGRSARR